MIDIHTHILPGVDDGAKTEADSLEMGKVAVEQGIQTIIATPHHRNGAFDNYKEEIITNVQILNELLEENKIPLEILVGQEVRIYGELLDDLAEGDIQTLADTSYILVEFPFGDVPQYAERLLYDLQQKGLRPIIAHPERNRELIENHDRMYELIRNGALAQLTGASLLGEYGKEIEQFSHQLIEANLVHFIASDAHNTDSRGFTLQEAYDVIRERYGFELSYMFEENSQLLLDDSIVNRNEPNRIHKKKSFFNFLRRK